MNNAVFGKTMKSVRKHRDIKLGITEARKNYLASEQDYHTSRSFSQTLLATLKRKSA